MVSWRHEWNLIDESVYHTRRADERLWQQARQGGPNIAGARARWDFPWEAQPGQYTITVKAMDTAGNTQPDSVPWNDQGYLYNAAVHHAVTVA